MKLIFLGTGTSTGIPVIGCSCSVCQSINPKNNRTRSSIYFTDNQYHFIIDPCLDLRSQAIREKIVDLDYIFVTHAHHDHIGGLDEVRVYNVIHHKIIELYAKNDVIDELKKRFEYCFITESNDETWRPKINPNIITSDIQLGNFIITPIPIYHGKTLIFGYRINNIAYITDCSFIPDSSYQYLKNLDVLIINSLRFKPHPKHFNIEQSITEAQKIGAKKTYFTHMNHHIDHEETTNFLPTNIFLAYDGLTLNF